MDPALKVSRVMAVIAIVMTAYVVLFAFVILRAQTIG